MSVSISNLEAEEGKRKGLVYSIATNKQISHGVFGCFQRYSGHSIDKSHGPSKHLVDELVKNEAAYLLAFDMKTESKGPEWKARVVKKDTEEETIFILTFNDRQSDVRGASHTDYAVVIPNNEEEIISTIENDPSLLVDVFRKVYPEYDRSEGILVVDPGHSEILQFPVE